MVADPHTTCSQMVTTPYSLPPLLLGSALATFTLVLNLLAFICSVDGYSFNIDNAPTACRNLSISIEGTDGQRPYSLVLIPYGPSPLGAIEVRQIQTYSFDTGATSLEFSLNWPANSQFVAVVSDQSGFASGGTSAPWKITSSGDTSCFDPTHSVSPRWPNFFISPDGLIRSCETSFIYWTKGNPNITGPVQFYGVIPSGTSFAITSTPTFNVAGEGTGFNWTVPANAGTDLILVSGDDTIGAGGYVDYIVSPPEDPSHVNCFSNMPTTTAYPPAGGDPSAAVPSASGESNSNDTEKHSDKVSAIVGGAIGAGLSLIAIVACTLVLLSLRQRRRKPPSEIYDKKSNYVSTYVVNADEPSSSAFAADSAMPYPSHAYADIIPSMPKFTIPNNVGYPGPYPQFQRTQSNFPGLMKVRSNPNPRDSSALSSAGIAGVGAGGGYLEEPLRLPNPHSPPTGSLLATRISWPRTVSSLEKTSRDSRSGGSPGTSEKKLLVPSRSLRVVNVYQHADASDSGSLTWEQVGEPEWREDLGRGTKAAAESILELPPAYRENSMLIRTEK